MADRDPNPDGQDRSVEVPGDTDAPDIVGRTGEQMPRQSHDGLDDERGRDSRETRIDEDRRDRM